MTAVREEAVTEVAQRLASMVCEEAVLAMPPLPVAGVEGVDVDVPAVAVERSAVAGGDEAVRAATFVGQAAKEVAVLRSAQF